MSELKPCPLCGEKVSMVSIEGSAHYWCISCEVCEDNRFIFGTKDKVVNVWNTRPAEDAKDREIERLNNELGIQKNLTRQACFEANRAYDEVEKWKKMFYDLFDKQASISTDPKVIVVSTDTNVPANAPDNNVGNLEKNK